MLSSAAGPEAGVCYPKQVRESIQRQEVDALLRRIRFRIQLSLTLRRALTLLAPCLVLSGLIKLILQTLGWPSAALSTLAPAALLGIVLVTARSLRRPWTLLQAAEYVDARIAAGDAVSASLQVTAQNPLRGLIEQRALRSLHRFLDRRAYPSVWTLAHLAIVPSAMVLAYLEVNPLSQLADAAPPGASAPAVREHPERSELPVVRDDDSHPSRAEGSGNDAEPSSPPPRGAQGDDSAGSPPAQLATVPATGKRARWLQELATALGGHPGVAPARVAAALGETQQLESELRQLALGDDQEARELARQALQRALEHSVDDPSAQRALTDQQALFERREQVGQLLQEAQRWVGDAKTLEARPSFAASGSDPPAPDLERVLKRLSPGERRQLEQRLKRELHEGRVRFELPGRRRGLELLDALEQPDGLSALSDELRRLSRSSSPVERQRRLESPATSLQPSPAHPQARGKPHLPPGVGSGRRGSQPHTGPSAGRAGSSAEHPSVGVASVTGTFEGLGANPRLEFNLPLVPSAPQRARPAQAAPTGLGLPTLGQTTPQQIEAVEQMPIPDQYREQVSRYFSPN